MAPYLPELLDSSGFMDSDNIGCAPMISYISLVRLEPFTFAMPSMILIVVLGKRSSTANLSEATVRRYLVSVGRLALGANLDLVRRLFTRLRYQHSPGAVKP